MTKHTVGILKSPDGDWEALYLDGELLYQDHRISMQQTIAILSSKMEFLSSVQEMTPTMLKRGICPDSFPKKRST